MAPVLKDRIKETTNTTGTGTFGRAGAVVGCRSFDDVGNGNPAYYEALDPIASPPTWETGWGIVVTGGSPTLSRLKVLSNSLGTTALINFVNSPFIFETAPADLLGVIANDNRIINGDMRIDQRNSGSSITPTASAYCLDRWRAGVSVASKFSVQQNAAAVTPPADFTKYLGITSLSSYSQGSGDLLYIGQYIEGSNCTDLNWGTANARAVTLSFWVRSSLTGQFGGAINNSANNRSYPFSYTINAANTWELKTVNIAGDTSGTWLTTTGIGISVIWDIGCGSTNLGAAGSWSGSSYQGATGDTKVTGTNAATWYITGVKLEKGNVPTPFVLDDYAAALAKCQRYYQVLFGEAAAAGTNMLVGQFGAGGTSVNFGGVPFPVTMRGVPTITFPTNGTTDGKVQVYDGSAASSGGTYTVSRATASSFQVVGSSLTGLSATIAQCALMFSATNTAPSPIKLDAEL